MSIRGMKAVVLWQRENKTGIEPITNVPENSRFVNAATTVRFSGDKKFYPAKVLMISGDDDALDKKASAVEKAIEDAKKNDDLGKGKRTKRKHGAQGSTASEQDIARAVGGKVPVPPELQTISDKVQREARDSKTRKIFGQNQLDNHVMREVRRSISYGDNGKQDGEMEVSHDDPDEDNSLLRDDNCDEEQSGDEDGIPANYESHLRNFLNKYCNPTCTSFLSDLLKLMQMQAGNESENIRYLELLPIPPQDKPVLLTTSFSVMIPMAAKDQLKVDFYNKPASLAKETLFVLFGKDAFQSLQVTGRGNKSGSYGVPENVLKALCGFVNRHIKKGETPDLKVKDLVRMINRRASEWRTRSTPLSKKRQSQKNKIASIVAGLKSPEQMSSLAQQQPSALELAQAAPAPSQAVAPPAPSPAPVLVQPLVSASPSPAASSFSSSTPRPAFYIPPPMESGPGMSGGVGYSNHHWSAWNSGSPNNQFMQNFSNHPQY